MLPESNNVHFSASKDVQKIKNRAPDNDPLSRAIYFVAWGRLELPTSGL